MVHPSRYSEFYVNLFPIHSLPSGADIAKGLLTALSCESDLVSDDADLEEPLKHGDVSGPGPHVKDLCIILGPAQTERGVAGAEYTYI